LAQPATSIEKVFYEPPGDKDTISKLAKQGGKGGAFVDGIREDVRDGKLHAAMHSLKDMPGNEETPYLVIGAYLKRGNVSDCLVLRGDRNESDLLSSSSLSPLWIGTTSVRRSAFLRRIYPGCESIHFRGAVVGSEKSRLHKLDNRLKQETEEGGVVGPADALVLAVSGLTRVGQNARISREFTIDEMLPAVGQGIVAVECRADDFSTLQLLSTIDHLDTRQCALAERELLWILNGHCNSPIAGTCVVQDGALRLRAAVMSLDGMTILETESVGDFGRPRELGRTVAFELLHKGADKLIEDSRI